MLIRIGTPASRMAALAALAALVFAATGVRADGPGPCGDGACEARPFHLSRDRPSGWGDTALRPPRRVTGGAGYVGSEWGLGKPSY